VVEGAPFSADTGVASLPTYLRIRPRTSCPRRFTSGSRLPWPTGYRPQGLGGGRSLSPMWRLRNERLGA